MQKLVLKLEFEPFRRIVPERTAFVIERFGKYAKTLTPGLHLLIPFVRPF